MAKKRDTRKAGDVRGRRKSKVLSSNLPWSVQEAYRVLRTNILFSLPGEGHKVIAVTSAFAHDGKSTNAINTAISFGQINKKVLLIDCDLRKPSLDSMLKTAPTPGLSDVLAGMVPITEALQPHPEYKIDVLPGGHIPPDATLLLESGTMRHLIQLLRDTYDYIFIDLPPLSMVTDAVILSGMVDGYLVVVRHRQTDYRAVNEAIEQIRFAEGRILGFIYNDFSLHGKRYGYGNAYGHGYGYDYGYGYGSKPSQ